MPHFPPARGIIGNTIGHMLSLPLHVPTAMSITHSPSSLNPLDPATLVEDDVRESLPEFTPDLYRSHSGI